MYSPSLDQGQKQLFQDNFLSAVQQKQSMLESAGVLVYLPSEGKTNNMARIGKIELTEVSTRNPEHQWGDYDLDNRQLTKRRFTKSIAIDRLYDINELVADPTSPIMEQLSNAVQRLKDRIIASAAGGAVLMGAPDESPTSVSAATDGVVTITATSAFNSTTIDSCVQTFINNDVSEQERRGAVLCVTGSEHADLMADDNFTSNLYIDDRPYETGQIRNVEGFKVVAFAGTDANITVSDPILTETSGTIRTCLVMCPKSVAISLKLANFKVIPEHPDYVDSDVITIDYWINAMRVQGQLVQKISTTIES